MVADVARNYLHWAAVKGLGEWCIEQGVTAVNGVDTRAIVTLIREKGSALGRITVGKELDADQDEAFQDSANSNLVKEVGTKAPFHIASSGNLHIALIDCGVKEGRNTAVLGTQWCKYNGVSVLQYPSYRSED